MITDKSPMPFGKYKGTAMANVPASYLLWLRNCDPAVLEYITKNHDILLVECGNFDKPNR